MEDKIKEISVEKVDERNNKGYCETCDTPNWKEHRDKCNICDGYLYYSQND